MKLFIDTWGWPSLRDRRKSRHAEVSGFYKDFRAQRGIAYTSDYVLRQRVAGTICSSVARFAAARR